MTSILYLKFQLRPKNIFVFWYRYRYRYRYRLSPKVSAGIGIGSPLYRSITNIKCIQSPTLFFPTTFVFLWGKSAIFDPNFCSIHHLEIGKLFLPDVMRWGLEGGQKSVLDKIFRRVCGSRKLFKR